MDESQSPKKYSQTALNQLQEFARQFALASLRKIPELVEAVPELEPRRPETRTVLHLVQTVLQTLPDHGQDLILELLGSELLLDIPEYTCEYPLRRETIRVLISLVYQPIVYDNSPTTAESRTLQQNVQ